MIPQRGKPDDGQVKKQVVGGFSRLMETLMGKLVEKMVVRLNHVGQIEFFQRPVHALQVQLGPAHVVVKPRM